MQQLASERSQREANQMAEHYGKILRELHEANAAMVTAKANAAEKAKQLVLKEDALKAAHNEAAKVGSHTLFAITVLPSSSNCTI